MCVIGARRSTNGQKLQIYTELIDRKRELIYGKFIKKKKG